MAEWLEIRLELDQEGVGSYKPLHSKEFVIIFLSPMRSIKKLVVKNKKLGIQGTVGKDKMKIRGGLE